MKFPHGVVEFQRFTLIYTIIIDRSTLKNRIAQALGHSKSVALVEPRQVGKTTLARELLPFTHPNYFDLENPLSRIRLEQPMTALQSLEIFFFTSKVTPCSTLEKRH